MMAGVGHSPFHRRRSLDEEESDDLEGRQQDEDGGEDEEDGSGNVSHGGHANDDDVDEEEGCVRGRLNVTINNQVSSSGSSDAEGGGGSSDDDDVIMSPRSPTFPRGGKVKPAALGGSGDPCPQSPVNARGLPPGGPEDDARMTQSDDVNNAAHCVAGPLGGGSADDLTMGGLTGELVASDSVANMFAIMPRNASGALLLQDLPSASDGPAANPDFMGL